MMAKRRRFGQIRKLPSGTYQASFVSPATGKRVNAPNTFRTKTDASRWLTQVEADISRGAWLDENLGRQAFGEYARAYLRDNPKIGPRWRETCLRNLRLHMTGSKKCLSSALPRRLSVNGTPPPCAATAGARQFSSLTDSFARS
jgi:hypothetical protein